MEWIVFEWYNLVMMTSSFNKLMAKDEEDEGIIKSTDVPTKQPKSIKGGKI